MYQSIILYEDSSTKITSKIQKEINKHNGEISYIFTPVGSGIDSYILQKITEPMIYFKKAIIQFEAVIKHVSQLDEISNNYLTVLQKVDKEVTDITELFQYIHSINRLKYINKLSNSNESAVFDLIEFTMFRLEIHYGKYKDNVLSKYMDLHTEKGEFGPREILKKIKSFYLPIKVRKNDIEIVLSNGKWYDIKKDKVSFPIFQDKLTAYYLPYTSSYTFFNSYQLETIKKTIKGCYVNTITGNTEITSMDDMRNYGSLPFETYTQKSETRGIRFHDMWASHAYMFIEYIIYLAYIYQQISFISELNDTNKYEEKYKCVSFIEIELISPQKYRSKMFECNSDTPIEISHILNMLYNIVSE